MRKSQYIIKSNLAGMTFLEILVTMTLLIVVVIGFIGVLSNGIKGTVMNKNAATAMSIAKSRLEKIKNEPYAVVASYTTIAEISTVTVGSDNKARLRVGFEFVDDAHDGIGSEDNDNNPNDYLQGSITVTWQEGNLTRRRALFYLITP